MTLNQVASNKRMVERATKIPKTGEGRNQTTRLVRKGRERQSQSPTPDEEGPQAQCSRGPLGSTVGQTSPQIATTITLIQSRESADPTTLRSDTILWESRVTHALGDYTDAGFPIALCTTKPSVTLPEPLTHACRGYDRTHGFSLRRHLPPSAMHTQILSALQGMRIHRAHPSLTRHSYAPRN